MPIRDFASLEDYAACVVLQDETWGTGFSERVPTAILRVSQLIGGVSAGEFDDDGRMIGFVFGMTGLRGGQLVHWSDMLAVRPEYQGRGIGERLKQYQRDKVLGLGVEVMLWTFDPLQARNAHFNINVLGAFPESYQPDMYGSNTGSTLHGALPTDRFITRWELRAPVTPSGAGDMAIQLADLRLANPLDASGLPAVSPDVGAPAPGWRVQIPADFSAIRADPGAAMRWRMTMRDAMVRLMAAGYTVIGFRRSEGDALPFYVLQQANTR